MRRILLVLSVAALMAAMLVASAMPVFAQEPPQEAPPEPPNEHASSEADLATLLAPDEFGGGVGPNTSGACQDDGSLEHGGCGEDINPRARDNFGQAQNP